MPRLENEQIREAIRQRRIKAISLDTSIFERNNRNLEGGLLARMSQFKDLGVKFVLSEIVESELKSHLLREAVNHRDRLQGALRDARKSGLVVAEQHEQVFKIEDSTVAVCKRLSAFQKATEYQSIPASKDIGIPELLRRYFQAEPPFEPKESKKSEFPDGFALLTLQSWAKSSCLLVLVATTDKGWEAFCDESENLVAITDLASALSLFHDEEESIRREIRSDLVKVGTGELWIAFDMYLDRYFERVEFNVAAESEFDVDGVITDWRVEDWSFLLDDDDLPVFEIIDADGNQLVVKVAVQVEMSFEAEFDFRTSDWFDSDASTFVGSSSERTSESLGLEVILTIANYSNSPTIREFEVLGSQIYIIDFRYVHPHR